MGSDANGYYLDIVDIHRYPFEGNSSHTRANVIDDPANVNGSNATGNFAYKLSNVNNTGLADRCSTANIGRSSSPLQFSVSELNVCWKNHVNNDVDDESANSFIAGQWMAEMYSVAMDKARAKGVDVAFMAPWSIHESSGNPAKETDLGIFHGPSPCTVDAFNGPRSTYQHMAMMGKYFRGSFYKTSNSSYPNVKCFGTTTSVTAGYYAIMIMNQNAVSYTYDLNTNGTSGSNTIKFNMAMGGTNRLVSNTINAKSTQMIFIDCNGNWKIEDYDETDAGAHLGFQSFAGSGSLPIALVMTGNPTGCASSTSSGSAQVTATAGSGTYSFSWLPTGGTMSNVGGVSTYSGLNANTYTVTVSNSSGCTAAQTEIITIAPCSPSVAITSPSNANSCTKTETFYAAASKGTSPYSYSWSVGGASGSSYASTWPGTPNTVNHYTVTVTDNKGCVNQAICSHYSEHEVTISGTTSAGTCCSITLTATYIPGASYAWTKNGSSIGSNSHVLTGLYGSGNYEVTANPGNLDPCPNATGTHTVSAGLGDCGCPEGPMGRYMNPEEAANIPIVTSEIQLLVPNPTAGSAVLYYQLADDVTHAEMTITNIFGETIATFPVRLNAASFEINCSELPTGIYFCNLFANGKSVSVKRMMVAK